ncbi:hypothetical protein PI124_g11790 [Phytophthora idaei]|nr:hypothetical protein PI125_g11309 [Phytophthora idaei]KAG3152460.1 hypothetical protein PI126_g10508 [Phytophthora idaei]KAG3243391.1 hypothetical protein PI124_g11790 [Phytophthora idaei]
MADNNEDQSTTFTRERGDGNTPGGQAPAASIDKASDLLALMRGITGRLEGLEESQTKLEKKLDAEKEHGRGDARMTPPMNYSLSASRLSRGVRMHIDSLDGSPRYFGQQQPGCGMLLSDLQRLCAAAQGAHGPPGPSPQQPQEARVHGGAGGCPVEHQAAGQIWYPAARQKNWEFALSA